MKKNFALIMTVSALVMLFCRAARSSLMGSTEISGYYRRFQYCPLHRHLEHRRRPVDPAGRHLWRHQSDFTPYESDQP